MNQLEAQMAGEKLQDQLGPGWHLDVWENWGWHFCCWRGPLMVYPSSNRGNYVCLMSAVFTGHRRASGGEIFWSTPGGSYATPREAVRAQLREAEAFVGTCLNAVAAVQSAVRDWDEEPNTGIRCSCGGFMNLAQDMGLWQLTCKCGRVRKAHACKGCAAQETEEL